MATHIDVTQHTTTEDHFSKVLLNKKLLSLNALQAAQTQAQCFGQTLFQHVMQYQLVNSEDLLIACVTLFKLPEMRLVGKKINHLYLEALPFHIIENNFLLPVSSSEENIIVAIANPNDIVIAERLSFQLGLSIKIVFTHYDLLYRLHNAYISDQKYRQLHDKNDYLEQSLSHQLLSDAIHRNASDIHFEPYQQYFRVRFRIDGLLHTIIQLPSHLTDGITSCLKVLSHMDIAIKRTPQDGRLAFHSYLGFYKDCRVSTCPTVYGEKLVIRLLDANTQIRAIEELGLNSADQKIILRMIQRPQGLILVTGPTGSGKTITLYTLLNLLNQSHRNIATIEDPVEMHIDGINQTHINNKSGLTFSQTLRALLRQDPDVMMIGEIRDLETAEMAIRAAQTGHLVLSTLHTNSAAEAITRLSHIGIAPFHLSAALTLIIAQRLVRKLCVACENGCMQCNNGFQGRIGIFELMPITEKMRAMILDNASPTKLSHQNKSGGHLDLLESAMRVVETGMTSMNEIYRVIPNATHKSTH